MASNLNVTEMMTPQKELQSVVRRSGRGFRPKPIYDAVSASEHNRLLRMSMEHALANAKVAPTKAVQGVTPKAKMSKKRPHVSPMPRLRDDSQEIEEWVQEIEAQEAFCEPIDQDGELENVTCSICLEDPNDPIRLPCKHRFCYKCFIDFHRHQSFAKINTRRGCRMCCPNCREEHLLMHDPVSGKFRANWRGMRKRFDEFEDVGTFEVKGDKKTSSASKPANSSTTVVQEGWVQCERCECWRVLAPGVLKWKGGFTCQMDDWSPASDKNARICAPVSQDEEHALNRRPELFPSYESDYKTFLAAAVSQILPSSAAPPIAGANKTTTLSVGSGAGNLSIARHNLHQHIMKQTNLSALQTQPQSAQPQSAAASQRPVQAQAAEDDIKTRLSEIVARVPFFVRALWAMLENQSTQHAM
jgi:hypothetical protein